MTEDIVSNTKMFSNVPIPDPSVITTQQITLVKAELREEFRDKIENITKIFVTRLDAMDHADSLLHENLTRIPTDTDRQVTHLKETSDEKFASIQLQFIERDVRSKAAEIAAQVAVGAALQAQKEAAAAQNDANAAAITKSELSVVKQIDGIQALIGSNTKALDEKIQSINSRLDRGEGIFRGNADTRIEQRDFRTENREGNSNIIAIIAAVIAVMAIMIGIIVPLIHNNSVPLVK